MLDTPVNLVAPEHTCFLLVGFKLQMKERSGLGNVINVVPN